jgi:hypothetical protein
MSDWIGVDLDGTLAYYNNIQGGTIGNPILPMVERVKKWLSEGKTVKIFTARFASHGVPLGDGRFFDAKTPIERWCKQHIGCVLEVTNVKDGGMKELWDDRCVQVITNTGIPMRNP